MTINHYQFANHPIIQQINYTPDYISFFGWYNESEIAYPEHTVAIWRIKWKPEVIKSQPPIDLPF